MLLLKISSFVELRIDSLFRIQSVCNHFTPTSVYCSVIHNQRRNAAANTRVLARSFTMLDAKDYGSLRDFYQKVVTADQQQIVLSPAAQATNQ